MAGTTRRTDLVHEPAICATVRRLPWTAPLTVLGVEVDLAALLADP